MQNLQNPLARQENLVVQEMPDEVLVYDLNTNQAHCLNKSAAAVWKNCDGNNSVSDIARLLKNEFNTAVTEDFIWLAIDQLGKDDLLETKQPLPAAMSGLSRRDMIRRVGLASLIALPVVASLAVPKPAYAAVPCNCANPIDCAGLPGCPPTTCTGGVCTA